MTRALARLFRLPTVPHVGGLGSPTCSRQETPAWEWEYPLLSRVKLN